MAVEPLADLWMLVRCVVAEDHMNCLARRDLSLEGVEEADELLMPMPLHVATDDRAVENVQRSKQRRRSMALVIMRHGPGGAFIQRSATLRAVARLSLAL